MSEYYTPEELVLALVHNTDRLGHPTQVAAGAASLYGIEAFSLCCWCAEHEPGEAFRLRAGGDCDRCSYTGRDCILIVPDPNRPTIPSPPPFEVVS